MHLYVMGIKDHSVTKCRVVYRTFWIIWAISMGVIALGQAFMGQGWIFYVIICLCVCLIPLCTPTDFVVSVAGVAAIARNILSYTEKRSDNFELIFYMTITMLIIGYVAQVFVVEVWTLREYIYVTTFIDTLTHLLNRRGGNALMEVELKKRDGKAELGVIMLDIDYFKKYNDSLGHDEGDNCLQTVAECIKQAVGERTQAIIRHGGEEFVVVLFDATPEETLEWAERIRKTVYDRGLSAPYRQVADVVTVSIGATVVNCACEERYENTLKTADMALYMAKENGRNQVVFRG